MNLPRCEALAALIRREGPIEILRVPLEFGGSLVLHRVPGSLTVTEVFVGSYTGDVLVQSFRSFEPLDAIALEGWNVVDADGKISV